MKKFFSPSIQDSDFGLCLFLLFFKLLSNCNNKSFWSSDKFTGVSIWTEHIKSPTFPPLTDFIPLPFNLKYFPVCVPDGILIDILLLLNVGISISEPNAASAKEIGTLQYKLLPSLSNIECFSKTTLIKRSPGGPWLIPDSPLPASLIRSPLSTPAGIDIDISLSSFFVLNFTTFSI